MSVAVRVIPCLDVAAGRVVKGVNFLNLRDAGDPIELARKYYEQGADEITFLDVKATVDNRDTMFDVVRDNPLKDHLAELGDASAFLDGAYRSMLIAYVPD